MSDGYSEGVGRLQVRLLGLPVQTKRGAGVAEGEAVRYLAELPWVPQAILANPGLEWRQIDATTVEVATRLTGTRLAVKLTFDPGGDIVQTTARRPRLEAHGELTPWAGHFSEYRELGGVRLPTRGEVSWQLPEVVFTYWRASVTACEHIAR